MLGRILCGTWALGCASMSIFTLLPAIKIEEPNIILLGGLLILILGVLYIAMEKSLLVSAAPTKYGLSAPKADGLSRTILGVQVGLIALAMFVTRSSVASLQAKQGLPLGTQMVGWFTLGELLSVYFFLTSTPHTSELDWPPVYFVQRTSSRDSSAIYPYHRPLVRLSLGSSYSRIAIPRHIPAASSLGELVRLTSTGSAR